MLYNVTNINLDRDDRTNDLCHVFSVVMLNAKIHVQHLHGLNGALVNQDIVTKITERKIESESDIKNRQFQVNRNVSQHEPLNK